MLDPMLFYHFSYKHAFDGLWKVYRNEGVPQLFGGATMASSRAVLVTVGQVRIICLTLFDKNVTASLDKMCQMIAVY